MLRFFHRLKVSQKLMMISVLFMIPDSVLLCLFLYSINSNIQFARLEQYGNEYQRPLEDLLAEISEHQVLLREPEAGKGNVVAALAAVQANVDRSLNLLEERDTELGAKLQFTDEGLAKRKREHYRVRNLKSEWESLKARATAMDPGESAKQHQHLIADVRTMITHVGDNSNLILDPDLDSYYLMDVTLLALPEMQERLASVLEYGEVALKAGKIPDSVRSELAVHAALLQQSDLDRVTGSMQTAFNEDQNFYGTSESLHRRVAPILGEFTAAATRFIRLTKELSEPDHKPISREEYLEAGMQARRTSFALWKTADEELDVLLEKRIEYYQARRARSLILTALALVAAVSFVTFITRSISGPLQKQAAELWAANQALQNEVAERQRVEVALRTAEEKYRSIFENAVEGIFQTTVEGQYLVANPTLARIYGYQSVKEMQEDIRSVGEKLYVDTRRRAEFCEQIIRFGTVRDFESQVYRKDGKIIWISEHARAVRDAGGQLLYFEGAVLDITDRKKQEAEVERLHKQLVDASRMAGMAEVATGVLHNVGNVLNSVNVSVHFVAETLRKSKLASLGKAASLLRQQGGRAGEFMATDPKGKQLPGFICDLSDHLTNEQEVLLKRMSVLAQHLDHIKEVVNMQQTYAKLSGVTEAIAVTEIAEDALRLNAGALTRHEVEVERRYEASPTIVVDKHKVLQILVNLIRNAKYACSDSARADKKMVLAIANGEGRVKISVKDNGVGIPSENLVRIFNHGFTTRKDGHGFGLHSGALAAKEMGGCLHVESGGLGRGATFILELPLQPPASIS